MEDRFGQALAGVAVEVLPSEFGIGPICLYNLSGSLCASHNDQKTFGEENCWIAEESFFIF